MEKRTKRLWIRVSEADMTLYKRKAESFGSVSDMVRTAVTRLNEPSVAERMRRVDELMKLCREIDNRLSWEGSNINQLARRANEAHRAGVIPGTFFTEVLMPELRNVRNDIYLTKVTLESILTKVIRDR
ncbi:MAG: hypothetical protein NC187_07625 [Candidatus Amulumruptor caecigallinarius]|nr:hypothetical protein [Candidatus Amulumruptor caecigallinarius]MCM1397338.1 hypothetical protein [Candidatus Amulumruptor caecigallinarius]MCM1453599.1 hypothetical protein [bacterium]